MLTIRQSPWEVKTEDLVSPAFKGRFPQAQGYHHAMQSGGGTSSSQEDSRGGRAGAALGAGHLHGMGSSSGGGAGNAGAHHPAIGKERGSSFDGVPSWTVTSERQNSDLEQAEPLLGSHPSPSAGPGAGVGMLVVDSRVTSAGSDRAGAPLRHGADSSGSGSINGAGAGAGAGAPKGMPPSHRRAGASGSGDTSTAGSLQGGIGANAERRRRGSGTGSIAANTGNGGASLGTQRAGSSAAVVPADGSAAGAGLIEGGGLAPPEDGQGEVGTARLGPAVHLSHQLRGAGSSLDGSHSTEKQHTQSEDQTGTQSSESGLGDEAAVAAAARSVEETEAEAEGVLLAQRGPSSSRARLLPARRSH